MRRKIAMLSVLGLLGAGLGCQHIGGKCDCQAHPSDAIIQGPTAPYPAIPVSALPVVPVIPPAKTNGKTEPKVDDKVDKKPESKPEPKKVEKNETSGELPQLPVLPQTPRQPEQETAEPVFKAPPNRN